MIFVEFGTFTRRRSEQMDEEEYRALQNVLLQNPEAGPKIPGTGGLRKLRWAAAGRGKRGGLRIIYYIVASRSVVLLLFLYAKGEQENLTPEQRRVLQRLVAAELAQWEEP